MIENERVRERYIYNLYIFCKDVKELIDTERQTPTKRKTREMKDNIKKRSRFFLPSCLLPSCLPPQHHHLYHSPILQREREGEGRITRKLEGGEGGNGTPEEKGEGVQF